MCGGRVIDDMVMRADDGGVHSSDHHIWFLATSGMQALDLVGPFEVFNAANEVADRMGIAGRRYASSIVSPAGPGVLSESGLILTAEALPDPASLRGTLVLPGGSGTRRHAVSNPDLVAWVAAAASASSRVATVCTGAFLAGAAGLLDGKRAATHWAWTDDLRKVAPAAEIDADAIWVRDDPVWSSAGVTAGIDLALAIVEADLGAAVAQTVARWFVVFLRRPGGQSQFSTPIWSDPAETEPVRAAQNQIHANPSGDLRLEQLATEVGLSARHLARRFQAEIGVTPARYVENVRVELARQLLEDTSVGLDAVARQAGLGTAESLRRCFQRRLGVSPSAYRQRFAAAS